MFKNRFLVLVISLSMGVFAVSCGKKSSTESSAASALSSVNLSSLPSLSDMAKSNSAAALASSLDSYLAVSGTPPTIASLTDANADTYFWNGMVAAINTAQVATASQKAQYWGGVDAGVGGQGACYMSQMVGESFGHMLQAGTSMCYMKNMPTATGGVTISSGTGSTLFAQGAAAKVVKVTASMQGQTMIVFIKVLGSDDVTSDVYKVRLWFCDNGAAAASTGNEEFIINKASSSFTATTDHNDNGGQGQSTVSAALSVGADGTISFDPTKDRTASMVYKGAWGKFKGSVTITSANKILAKMFNENTWGGNTWKNHNYAVASFSGSSVKTLKFLAGGYKGRSYNEGDRDRTYVGGTEFRDTYYVAATTSALATEAGLMNFATDSFYTSNAVSAFAAGATDSCSAPSDVQVTMDFANASVAAISEKCEGERFDNYSYCNSAAIQAANARLWN